MVGATTAECLQKTYSRVPRVAVAKPATCGSEARSRRAPQLVRVRRRQHCPTAAHIRSEKMKMTQEAVGALQVRSHRTGWVGGGG